MSRGIRQDTLYRIRTEHERDSLALGPFLGELAVSLNMTASIIATAIRVHEQTVVRWFFGATIPPKSLITIMQLLPVLVWMHDNHKVLRGTTNAERRADLMSYTSEFISMSSRDAQTTV
jgi:hypothetical protein